MSTYAAKTYNAKDYLKYRPVYPNSLYEHLRKYLDLKEGAKVDLAVDLGCGSGQATVPLAQKLAKNVVGVDNSQLMIDEGYKNAGTATNINFMVGNDKTITSQFVDHSVDLLTVAEAAHWLSYPDFWKAAHSILKPGGTLAIWSYYIFSIIDYPEVAQIIEDFNANPEKCGGYWNSGQGQLDNLYADLKLPLNLFDNEERIVNDYYQLRPEQPFEMVKEDVPLDALIKLMGTWSGYHNWKIANPGRSDILDDVQRRILACTGLTPESRVTVKWNSVLIYAKARSNSE